MAVAAVVVVPNGCAVASGVTGDLVVPDVHDCSKAAVPAANWVSQDVQLSIGRQGRKRRRGRGWGIRDAAGRRLGHRLSCLTDR